MSQENGNNMETVCGSLDADGVAANFTGAWRSWGKVDPASVVAGEEGIYQLFDRAGLAFKPLAVSIKYDNPVTGETVTPDEEFAVLRGDTGAWLGRGKKNLADSLSVGGHFETLEALVGELSQTALPCRAISFRNGARAVIQLLIPEERIILDRPHRTFYSVYNALDGSSNAKIGFSDYCPVCENTFAALKREIGSEFKARHTTNMGDKLAIIRGQILEVGESVQAYYGTLEKLATLPAPADIIRQFVQAVIIDTPAAEKSGKVSQVTVANRSQIATAIQVSVQERNGSGTTFYDLLQGVTRVSSSKDAFYSLFGGGARHNEMAMAWLENAASAQVQVAPVAVAQALPKRSHKAKSK